MPHSETPQEQTIASADVTSGAQGVRIRIH